MKYLAHLSLLAAVAAGTPLAKRQVLAAGTIANCDSQLPANEISTCESMLPFAPPKADGTPLTLSEFLTYNPSLKADCSGLVAGQAYCTHVPAGSEPPSSSLVKPVKPAGVKAPGKSYGASGDCQKWQKVFAEDVLDKKGACEGIGRIWGGLGRGDTMAWLMGLNPGLEKDCANLEVNSYLCVAVPTQTS